MTEPAATDDVIAAGDEARLEDGRLGKVISIEKILGLYVLDVDGVTVARRRHEFEVTKWDGDTIGRTGIGVCAKNSSEEMA